MSDQKPGNPVDRENPANESVIADLYNVNSGVRPFGRSPWDADQLPAPRDQKPLPETYSQITRALCL